MAKINLYAETYHDFFAKRLLKFINIEPNIVKSKLVTKYTALTADEYYQVHGKKTIRGTKAHFIGPFQHVLVL